VGAFAGWKKYDDLSYAAEPTSEKAESDFRKYVSRRREELARAVASEMLPKVTGVLEEAMCGLAETHQREVLGSVPEATVQQASQLLRWASRKLEEVYSVKDRPSNQDLWREAPIAVTPQDGNFKLESLFGSVRSRLDLVIPALNFSLARILFHLPSSVAVRLVTTCTDRDRSSLASEIRNAFGTWAGEHKVRLVVNPDGSRVNIPQALFVTPESSLVTSDNLRGIGQRVITLDSHASGHLAAQREFAEYWEGRSASFGKLRVYPV